jgi:hypothetical protein
VDEIRHCRFCQIPYDWRRSESTLKLTYCGILCERAVLGFTIEGITRILLIKGHGLQGFATKAASALDTPIDEEPVPMGQPMPAYEPPPAPAEPPTNLWGWPFYPAT